MQEKINRNRHQNGKFFHGFWKWAGGLCFFSPLVAQDPVFTQIFLVPNTENPALLTDRFCFSAGVITRTEWYLLQAWNSGYTMAYWTTSAFASLPVPKIRSGFSFLFSYDRAGAGMLKTYRGWLTYTYMVELRKSQRIHLGGEVIFWQQFADRNRLVFGDQLDDYFGQVAPASLDHLRRLRSPLLVSAGMGIAWMAPSVLLGVAIHHLNQPNAGFSRVAPEGTWKFRYSFQMLFALSRKRGTRVIWWFPYLFGSYQAGFFQVNTGIYGAYRMLEWNLGWRQTRNQPDALLLGGGVRYGNWRFYYTYDVTVSRLGLPRTAGVHEISVVFRICPDSRVLRLQCPFDVWSEEAVRGGKSRFRKSW